jgi:hypothetical protein
VRGDGIAPRLDPEQAGLSGGGAMEPEQEPDGRRLARSVGAQESVDLPGGDGEIEAVER